MVPLKLRCYSQGDNTGLLTDNNYNRVSLLAHADCRTVPHAQLTIGHRVICKRQHTGRGCQPVSTNDDSAIMQRTIIFKNAGDEFF